MFKSLKKIFGLTTKEIIQKKSPHTSQSTTQESYSDTSQEPIRLNTRNAKEIIIPKLQEPDFDYDRKPNEYWEIYNKAVSHYKRKWYEKAKVEFIKLLEYDNPHDTLYTYLLRTFRKLTSRNIEKNNLKEAYQNYLLFFEVCENYITNTDRKKFNKLVERINEIFSDTHYKKIQLEESRTHGDYEIQTYNNREVTISTEEKNDIKPLFKDTSWQFQGILNKKPIYGKRIFNKNISEYDKTIFIIKNFDSNTNDVLELNYNIIDFYAATNSNTFIFLTEDLKLILYSLNQGIVKETNFQHITHNKNYIRSIIISANGDLILYTVEDAAYLLDSRLEQIGSWKSPVQDGWELQNREQSGENRQEIQSALEQLDLDITGTPSNEDIKKAYRKKMLGCHPDLNQNDPKAKEKTYELIQAYEMLTGEEAQLAFKEQPNSEYYYKLIEEYKMELPEYGISFNLSFGYVGSGKDWIYASNISKNSEHIYLGCYSGKVYEITKEGIVDKIYDCHETIRSIREIGNYLYIENNYHLLILKNNNFISSIEIWKQGELIWNQDGIMQLHDKQIKLYENSGKQIAKINFTKPLYEIRNYQNLLSVKLNNKTYSFKINSIIN